jgi:hypothetical protein
VSAPKVTAAPLTVSDASAPAIVGLTPRQFRRFVREKGIPCLRVGRRTLVRADLLLEAIDRLSGSVPRPAPLDEQAVIDAAVRS